MNLAKRKVLTLTNNTTMEQICIEISYREYDKAQALDLKMRQALAEYDKYIGKLLDKYKVLEVTKNGNENTL